MGHTSRPGQVHRVPGVDAQLPGVLDNVVSTSGQDQFTAVTVSMARIVAGRGEGYDPTQVLMEPMPAMMQNLWTARSRQQTPVDVVADKLLWPLGQVIPRCMLSLEGNHCTSFSCVGDLSYRNLLRHAEAGLSKTRIQEEQR